MARATKSALRKYRRAVRDPIHRLWDRYGCSTPECCPDSDELRQWLETVLRRLPPHAQW